MHCMGSEPALIITHHLVLEPATSFSSQIQHHQGLSQACPFEGLADHPSGGQDLQARELAFGLILRPILVLAP